MAGDNEAGAYDPFAPRRPSQDPNLDGVAAAIRDAEGEDALLSMAAHDPLPGGQIDGIRPGEWMDFADAYGLPPDCPVLPLGTDDGTFFFLDTIGQMRAMKGGDLGQSGINELFMGRHLWLTWAWPKSVRDTITSWRPERVREALMAACAKKGTWSPMNSVRGRGLWKGRDGRLILHCGDRLFSIHGDEALGELEGKVYPTRPPIERPWPNSLAGRSGPCARLIPHFRSWRWGRPALDPILLIGAIAVGYMGGALNCRPALYVLGDKATGKSALHNDIKALQGDWLVNTGDTTSAGLYQELKFDSLPVAIDEFEAKADNRKAKAVVELMRISYTGAPMKRGGDNHKGTQFHGRSAFTFSSINMPAMEPQDLSRMAILRLNRQPKDAVKPVIPDEDMAQLGRQILRRLMDNWPRWNATLEAWRNFLGDCGHDGRGQDTFGTLMAAADLVIADDAIGLGLQLGPNAEDFEEWRDMLTATAMPEFQDAAENWQLCLSHLLSKRIEAWRGGTRHTVGEVLAEFRDDFGVKEDAITFNQARKLLEQTGMTIMKPTPEHKHFTLLIPNQNTLLYDVFRDTKWQGELGAGTWSGALRQCSLDIWRDASARINGQKAKGVAFNINDIIVTEKEAEG